MMKGALRASASILAVAAAGIGAALAADVYRAPEPVIGGYKDAPYFAYNWTGLYAGGYLGAALATTDIADPFGAAFFGDHVRSPGFIGGGQIGYNYQLGSMVFGLEA